jgi:hypothetical protein
MGLAWIKAGAVVMPRLGPRLSGLAWKMGLHVFDPNWIVMPSFRLGIHEFR